MYSIANRQHLWMAICKLANMAPCSRKAAWMHTMFRLLRWSQLSSAYLRGVREWRGGVSASSVAPHTYRPAWASAELFALPCLQEPDAFCCLLPAYLFETLDYKSVRRMQARGNVGMCGLWTHTHTLVRSGNLFRRVLTILCKYSPPKMEWL